MARTTSILLVLLVLSACMADRSLGAATVYTDRASFEAAIGPHVTYTFETNHGFPAAPVSISSFGPVIVTSGTGTGGGPAFIRNYPDNTTNQTISGDYDDINTNQLNVSFDATEYAVGFDDYPYRAPAQIDINYSGSGGTYYENYTLPNGDLGSSVFFGLTSTDPIFNITVRSVGDSKSQQYKGIDNLTIVPEPPSWGLFPLLAGILLLGLRSRGNQGQKLTSASSQHSTIDLLEELKPKAVDEEAGIKATYLGENAKGTFIILRLSDQAGGFFTSQEQPERLRAD